MVKYNAAPRDVWNVRGKERQGKDTFNPRVKTLVKTKPFLFEQFLRPELNLIFQERQETIFTFSIPELRENSLREYVSLPESKMESS